MPEQPEEALHALDLALEVERGGHRFYSRAAQSTRDANGRWMFMKLAHGKR